MMYDHGLYLFAYGTTSDGRWGPVETRYLASPAQLSSVNAHMQTFEFR